MKDDTTEQYKARMDQHIENYRNNFLKLPSPAVIEERGNWRVLRWPPFNDVVMFSIRWSTVDIQSLVVGNDEVLFANATGQRTVPRWCWQALAAAVALEPLSGLQKVNPSDWEPPPA